MICTSGTDYTDDNFDYRNIRFTLTQKCKGQDREPPLSFANDEVFVINKIQTRSMRAQPKLNTDSPIEEILDFNVNSESEIKTRLNLYNQKDRFINYILLHYPHVNLEKLIKLQKTDPFFEIIIGECNLASNKTYLKESKHGISFVIRQGILIRTFVGEEGLNKFRFVVPK